MKRQNLKSTLKTLLAGFCIASGGVAFAGSVTVSGTAGTDLQSHLHRHSGGVCRERGTVCSDGDFKQFQSGDD